MGNSRFNKIPGGKAARSKPSDFDPRQLAMGIDVEREHGKDPKQAREIAMDHLKEFPDYYTRLKRMEKSAEKSKKESVMEIHQLLGLLEDVRDSFEEAVPVKATGQTSGYLPGVSRQGEKSSHFKRFPQKTAADTKAREQAQRMKGGSSVQATAPTPTAAIPPQRKKGLMARAVSRLKGKTESMFIETTDIRSLLEVARLARLQAMDKKSAADSAYGTGVSGSSSANSSALKKARASVKASEFAAKFQKGKSHRQYSRHSDDAENMRQKQNALATVGDRIKHGPQ